jgi:hypothetical protein
MQETRKMKERRERAYRFATIVGAVLGLALFAHSARAECLNKPVNKPDGTVGKQVILAPKAEIAKYEARGYRVEACTADVAQLRRATEMLCPAAGGPQPGDAARGFTFSEICASARAAVAELELATPRQP